MYISNVITVTTSFFLFLNLDKCCVNLGLLCFNRIKKSANKKKDAILIMHNQITKDLVAIDKS